MQLPTLPKIKFPNLSNLIKPVQEIQPTVNLLTQQKTTQQEESKLKDLWDSLVFNVTSIGQSAKQYFTTTLPQMAVNFVEDNTKSLRQVSGYTPEQELKIQETSTKLKTELQGKYEKNKQQFENWVVAHPELAPRTEWEGSPIDVWNRNPKAVLDPYYVGYVATQIVPYAVATMGTTAATLAITKNPAVAIAAGMAVATPIVSQDLYDDLIASGANVDQALELTAVIGPVISAVEIVSDLPVLKTLGIPFASILRKEATKEVAKLTSVQILKKGLWNIAEIETIETLEEIVQQGIQNATVKTINNNRSLFEAIPETAVSTLIGTIPFSLFGGGRHLPQYYKTLIEEREEEIEKKMPGFERVPGQPLPVGGSIEMVQPKKPIVENSQEIAEDEYYKLSQEAMKDFIENETGKRALPDEIDWENLQGHYEYGSPLTDKTYRWIDKYIRGIGVQNLTDDIAMELEYFRPDKSIKLYRGGEMNNSVGGVKVNSWTHDIDVAKSFAGKDGIIYEAIVEPKDIIFDSKMINPNWDIPTFTNESEVLVRSKIKGKEMAKIPMEAFYKGKEVEFNLTEEEGRKLFRGLYTQEESDFIFDKSKFPKQQGKFSLYKLGAKYQALVEVVSKNGKVSSWTIYHEAFHTFINKFVPKELRIQAINEILEDQKHQKRIQEKIKEYELQDNKEGRMIAAEELLAEGFATYMGGERTFVGKILALYIKIESTIKEWIGKEKKVYQMYRDLEAGRRPYGEIEITEGMKRFKKKEIKPTEETLIQEARKYKGTDPIKYAEKLGYGEFYKELGNKNEGIKWAKEYWAKEGKPDEYFHIGSKEIIGKFDKQMEKPFDIKFRVGKIGAINGLYVGKDESVLRKFYGLEGIKKTIVSTKFYGNPKWLDLTNHNDEENFIEDVVKRYNVDRKSSDFGDALEREVLVRGYDGVKYFDPVATGEEYVLVNPDALSKTKTLQKEEFTQLTPEQEAEYRKEWEAEANKEIETAEKFTKEHGRKLFSAIKALGGLKVDPHLRTEMSEIPKELYGKEEYKTMTPDQMIDQLKHHGFVYEDASALIEDILNYKSGPERFKYETRIQRINRVATEIGKIARRTERETAQQARKLQIEIRKLIKEATVGRNIPPKKVIEKITGIRPEERKITMKESKLLRERFKNIASGARSGKIGTKREIMKTQTDLVDIIDASDLELADKAKFRRTVKNIQSAEQLRKALPEIESRIVSLVEKSEIRTLKGKIRDELSGTQAKLQAGKPVGKYTADVQKVLDFARSVIRLTQLEAETKIEENLEKYKTMSMPIEVALQNRILDMNAQGPEGLKDLLNTIVEMKQTGKMANALRKFNIQEELDRTKNYLVDVMTEKKGIQPGRETTGPERMTLRKAIKQRFMSLGYKFVLGWNGLVDILDWHTPVGRKTLAKKFSVMKQEDKFKELQEGYTNDFNQMMSEVFGLDNKTLGDKTSLPIKIANIIGKLKKEVNLGKFKNASALEVEMKMTTDEMIKRYMEFKDETLYDSFANGNKYTEEIKKAITSKLTTQEKMLGDKQLEMYGEQYKKINPLYREMFGVDLPFNEFYSPIIREGYQMDTKQGFEILTDEVFYRRAVNSKSFIKRIKNILPIGRRGSLQALDRHISDTNYFLAWAEKVRELDHIFSDATVRESIRQEFGGNVLKEIQNTIDDFAQERRVRGQLWKPVDFFRKKFTLGVLALKPALAAKQMTSVVAYLERLSAVDFTTGVIDFWKNPIKNYQTLAKESTYIRTRGKQGEIERDIRAAMSTEIYKRMSKINSFWNIMMMNIRFGDKGAIITGSWAMRKASLKQGKSIQEVVNEYEEFSSETQQSADISQLSAFQKGGSLEMLFTMFRSAPRQYLAKELNAIKNLFQKEGLYFKNIKKTAKTLAVYHLLIPFIFQYVANFGGWDDDDKKEYLRAMLFGQLNGLFIFGDAIDWALRKALGMKVWDIGIPVYQTIQDVATAITKIDIDDITSGDFEEALKGLASVGEGFAIPSKYLLNLPKGIEKLLEQEWREGLGLMLGWSEYALGITKKKATEPKKTPLIPKIPELPKLPKLPKLKVIF